MGYICNSLIQSHIESFTSDTSIMYIVSLVYVVAYDYGNIDTREPYKLSTNRIGQGKSHMGVVYLANFITSFSRNGCVYRAGGIPSGEKV